MEQKKLLKKHTTTQWIHTNRMNAIFMNSKNSRTSDPHRLLLNLSDKMNVKRSEKYVALSNLSIYYTRKNIKK